MHRPLNARFSICIAILLSFSGPLRADTLETFRFGPYIVNSLSAGYSPFASDLSLPHLGYHFQLGWLEPIKWTPGGIFHGTYFKSTAKANVTPYQVDIGTSISVKPLHFLEFGLSYNRMNFLQSMVTFSDRDQLPPSQSWRPDQILSREGDWGGADIFTFSLDLGVEIGRLALQGSGTHALWDVKARDAVYVFEYGNDLLIRTSDRVNTLEAAAEFDLKPWVPAGIKVMNRYSMADRSGVEKNLVAAGLSGLRYGSNGRNEKRGLDFLIGYWTLHPHASSGSLEESLVLVLEWIWDIRLLEI